MDSCRIIERNEDIVIPPGYEHIVEPAQYDRVEKTWRDWNDQVRRFLIGETGLKLSVGGKQNSVQVSNKNYIPTEFDLIIKVIGMENWLLGRKLPMLLGLQKGTTHLKDYIDRNPNVKTQLGLEDADVESVADFRATLNLILEKLPRWQLDLRARFRDINEDVLGSYTPQRKSVELHWIPIAIYAEVIGVSIEDLTLVVLTHELAHAYTHVGMDIDGEQWETGSMVASDRAVLEGLAQYYTLMYLRKIEAEKPEALKVFHQVLETQASDYHTHKTWMDGDQAAQGEAIRLAMLEARLEERGCSASWFEASVAENKQRLRRHGSDGGKIIRDREP
jgi:hypothetical protein